MTVCWIEMTIESQTRTQLIDITRKVSAVIQDYSLQSGICHLFVPHTTAGVTINENADPDVVDDIIKGLRSVVSLRNDFRHSEGNSDAHIQASLVGFSTTVPIIDGKPALGTWQGIYFCEFDGPRRRRVLVGIG